MELYDEDGDDENKYYSCLDDCDTSGEQQNNNNATPNEYCHPVRGPPEPGQDKEYSALGEPEPPPITTSESTDMPYYISLKNDNES